MTPDKNAGEPGITAKPGNDLQKYDWDLVGTYDETIVQLVSIKNKKNSSHPRMHSLPWEIF